MRKHEAEAKQREQSILDSLKQHGPQGTADLRRTSQLGQVSASGFSGILDRLEVSKKIRIDRKGEGSGSRKVVRLPEHAPKAASLSSRRFANKRSPMGAEASKELVDRALVVFESGLKIGPFALARELECTPAEAIDAIGKLRAGGLINNYFRDCFAAVIPHPPKVKRAA